MSSKNTHPALRLSFAHKYKPVYGLMAVLLITAALYMNALFNGFVTFDDDEFILDNALIHVFDWQALTAIFTTDQFGHYHPLTTLINWFSYAVFGPSPLPFHATNLVFHLINIALLFALLRQMRFPHPVTVGTICLFAIHPMNTEAVSWISARSTLIYTTFYLLAIQGYLRYLTHIRKKRNYFCCLVFFILALLAKNPAVVLPVLMFVIDWYYQRKFTWRVVVEKVPFFTLSFASGILSILAAKHYGSFQAVGDTFTIADRFFMVPYTVAFYLVKFLAPLQLSAIHYNPIKIGGWLPWLYYTALPALAGLTALSFRFLRSDRRDPERMRPAIFGLLFFLVNISIFTQFLPIGNTIASERYAYISYAGLSLLAVTWGHTIFRHSNTGRKFVTVLAATYFLFFAITVVNRNKVWHDNFSLFHDVREKFPDRAYAYFALGLAFANQGEDQTALQYLDKAVERNPEFILALNNRGNIKAKLHNHAGAILDFDKAISIHDRYGLAYYNRALSRESTGDLEGKLADLKKAVECGHDQSFVYYNAGNTMRQLGNYAGALQAYDEAVRQQPDYYDAINNRGIVKYITKDYTGAMVDFSKAITLHPLKPDPWLNRGNARYYVHDLTGACSDWKQAVIKGNQQAVIQIREHCK